jgi:hypothetical protein
MITDDSGRKDLVRYALRVRRRLRFVRAVEAAQRALFWSLCALVLLAAAHKLLALSPPPAVAAAVLGSAALLWTILAAWFPFLGPLAAAGAADAAAGWKERLSTALALSRPTLPMEQAVLEDARRLAASSPPSRHFQPRIKRGLKFAPAPAAAAVAILLWAPALDLAGVAAKERAEAKEKEDLRDAVRKLENRREEIKKMERPVDRGDRVAKKLDQLARELNETPPPERKEAMAKIASAADELRKMRDGLAKAQSTAERLQKALMSDRGESGGLGRMMRDGKFDAAAREMAKLRNTLQDGKLPAEEKAKLERELKSLMDRLAKDKELSKFEQELAKALQGLSMGKEAMMDGLQSALEGLDGELSQDEMLAEALRDLEGLSEALAKDKHRCPS